MKQQIDDIQKTDEFCKKVAAKLAGRPSDINNGIRIRNVRAAYDILYYKSGRRASRIVVPKCLRKQILIKHHDDPCSGHFGSKKDDVFYHLKTFLLA